MGISAGTGLTCTVTTPPIPMRRSSTITRQRGMSTRGRAHEVLAMWIGSSPATSRKLAVALFAAALALPSQLFASSCNNPIVVPIQFKGKAQCWEHRGKGTHFFGQFLKGQNISVGAAGGTKYTTDGDLSWTIKDPWQISIEGPGGFSSYELGGVLYAKLPATGKYVVSLGPCAIWGAQGTVVLCASDPRLIIE
jgi:hypothetical protein